MQDVGDPGEEDKEARALGSVSEKVIHTELVEGGELALTKFVYKLFCGCTGSDETRAKQIRFGVHGKYCETHGEFSYFVDVVSSRPLVDRWGRA